MANKLVSILPSGTNNYLTPSLSFNRVATDLVTPGVVGAITNTSGVSPATGNLAVNAQGSPNMTVAVSAGIAYVAATPSGGTAQNFGVTSDAAENVTIAANSTGSTRYDFIYLQLDTTKLNTPAVNGLDVATFVTSRSTTAYDSTNTTNYGNSNGAQAGLLLAVVTVANGAASIGNSSITDARKAGLLGVNALQQNAVQASQLATGAITLGYAQITTAFNTASTSYVQVTGLTVTCTIPAGGRRVKITVYAQDVYSSTTNAAAQLTIWDGAVGSGTQIGTSNGFQNGAGATPGICMAVQSPSAGTKTYNVGFKVSAGTGQIDAGTALPAFILVEAI